MKRAKGYYWVKIGEYISWEIAEYAGNGEWYRMDSDYGAEECDIAEINENRILSPDEK